MPEVSAARRRELLHIRPTPRFARYIARSIERTPGVAHRFLVRADRRDHVVVLPEQVERRESALPRLFQACCGFFKILNRTPDLESVEQGVTQAYQRSDTIIRRYRPLLRATQNLHRLVKGRRVRNRSCLRRQGLPEARTPAVSIAGTAHSKRASASSRSARPLSRSYLSTKIMARSPRTTDYCHCHRRRRRPLALACTIRPHRQGHGDDRPDGCGGYERVPPNDHMMAAPSRSR